MRTVIGCTFVLCLLTPAFCDDDPGIAGRWSQERAQVWGAAQPWLVGCNFIPSSAINQLEMWQAETFDPETIDRELGWAADLGFNTVRVYLHDLAWEADKEGFKKRIDQFLEIARKHGIRPVLVLFDDCWNEDPKIGKQPEPIPGVHNSGWLQSPGKAVVNDPVQWDRLEAYVKDVVGTFAEDDRILLWDLYNEPGNSGQGMKSLPLLKKAFEWARAAKPSQPLSAGVFYLKDNAMTEYQTAASDVITFHDYGPPESMKKMIAKMKKYGRPVICTEWMRRPASAATTHMPMMKEAGVGAINWGLVSGKTQTIFPWGSKKGAAAPKRWFHDLLHPDGKPFDAKEAVLFKELTGKRTDVRKIWDAGKHNAFTDLIRWKGRFYCTFRESTAHVPTTHAGDGKIRVIASDDGKTWEAVDLLAKEGIDLRDSKLSITPDGRLMTVMGGSYYDKGKLLKRVSQVAFMSDPEKGFGPVTAVEIDESIRSKTDWLWRVTWNSGVGYGVVYQAFQDPWGLHLVKTTDGIHYDLVKSFELPGRPNETTVRFDPDGTMLLFVRNEDGKRRGHLGRSKRPYSDWTWHDIDMKLGGPDAIRLPNGTWVLGSRFYGPRGARTVLARLDDDGRTMQVLRLPSGGDTSYPGMCVYDGKLWVSYYSSHEGKTSIYLTAVPLEWF